MSITTGLSDTAQAYLTLGAFILPAFSIWSVAGFPIDHLALGLLVSNVITGFLLFAKEKLGAVISPPVPVTQTAAKPTA